MPQAFGKAFAQELPKDLLKEFRQACLNLIELIWGRFSEGFVKTLKPNKNDSQEQKSWIYFRVGICILQIMFDIVSLFKD